MWGLLIHCKFPKPREWPWHRVLSEKSLVTSIPLGQRKRSTQVLVGTDHKKDLDQNPGPLILTCSCGAI